MSYPAGPPRQPKANRSLGVLIIVAVALVAVCVVLGCIGVVTDDRADDDKGLRLPAAATTAPAVKGAPVPKAEPPKARALEAGDIKISVKTTRKQCFGSAGCSLQYKIEASVDLDVLAATDKDWAVTYEVKGDEDGPQIGQLTLHPDGIYEQDSYQTASTTRNGVKLTAKVTDVEPLL